MNYRPKVFYTHYGEKVNIDSQFWFPMNDTKSRIELLKKVIKETE